jgi:hypothetical protein
MWNAIKRNFTQESFRQYVDGISWGAWRPSLIVWHNTAAPSLAQWHATADKDRKAMMVPGQTRINNLERYFRDERGWSGCPHLFVADDFIWVMNPLTRPGVHSPSWNSRSIGIEMVADFDREDDDTGAGLQVRNHTIFATALLCETFGLDPEGAIKLHREDPATTHACPGMDFALDKANAVHAVEALLLGGEHGPHDVIIGVGDAPLIKPAAARAEVIVNGLNLRNGPGVRNAIIGELDKPAAVTVLDHASNGATGWSRVQVTDTGRDGWVASRYIREV